MAYVRRYVPSGIVTEDVLADIKKAKVPLVKIYHYHVNHLGTPQELSDESGNIIWLSYDRAWGGSFDSLYRQQFVDNWAVSENELQPFKFQGQCLDTETGLHYNRFRYYDSDVGMFISRDPIGLLGGSNVFQYAPNPIGWIDPWGLSCTKSNKFSNLSRSERTALMEQKLEANARRRLQELRNRSPSAHFLDRHGAHLDLQSQMDRATHGIDPHTGIVNYYQKGSKKGQPQLPSSASRFFSNRDQLNAITRAEQIFKNTGKLSDAEKPINFGRPVGSGYARYGSPYSINNFATVWLDNQGLAKTAFPS